MGAAGGAVAPPPVAADEGGGAAQSPIPSAPASEAAAAAAAPDTSAQAGAGGNPADVKVQGDTNQIVDPNCVARIDGRPALREYAGAGADVRTDEATRSA